VGAGVSAVDAVVWHDLECGGYDADLAAWAELAARRGAPVLDVGAGTGRVAVALARAGHEVIALERDGDLAAELERRAAGLRVEVRCGDACAFALPSPVPLCIVPMQTFQLLADAAAFLRCARDALRADGMLAVALLGEGVEPFDLELDADAVSLGGVRYESAPLRLERRGGVVEILRRRSRSEDSDTRFELDRVRLRECDADALAAAGLDHGFALAEVIAVPPTREHAGSTIVCLEAVA
jgi:SAM-dependent methyltransferase